MAETLLMRRKLGQLVPVDGLGEDVLQTIHFGEVVEVTFKRKRNVGHHRKYMALLAAIFPHQNVYPTLELFRTAIACALGWGDMATLPDGRVVMVARSIAFAKMDQGEFEAFYTRALEVIETRILPRIDRRDVEAQVTEILDGYR